MNDTAARNNLRYAGYDEVAAPTGERWRVRIVRPTDPRHAPIGTSVTRFMVALLEARVRRVLLRDRRWSVELAAPNVAWHYASVVETVDGRDAAIERAIGAMNAIAEGRAPTEPPVKG